MRRVDRRATRGAGSHHGRRRALRPVEEHRQPSAAAAAGAAAAAANALFRCPAKPPTPRQRQLAGAAVGRLDATTSLTNPHRS